jgi:NAD-dependent DNA ligase
MKIIEVIELLKADPDSTLKSLDGPEIKKIIDYLSEQYYNKNISLVSDQLFDIVKEYYEKEFGKKYEQIGAPVSSKSGNKVELPYWMGSLDKIKPSTNAFEKWIKDYLGPYVLSYKLDGVSALLYKTGGKVYMYTRGNGIEGQDITHCIGLMGLMGIMGINTNKLIEGDAIRGELIISKENFKKISDKMANPRNAVSGIINTKKPDPNLLKLIDFVGYWVLSPQLKASEQLKYIEKKEFVPRTVEYVIKKTLTMDELSKMLVEARNTHKYEIDGIVVIDNSQFYPLETGSNPSYGFAFKQLLTDQIAESTVIDVIWEVSKDKYIKPKIKINTVELGGVEITYATGFNAKFIVDNVIGPGSVVQIVRSGDVIPKIEKVLKPSDIKKPKMPNIKYIWNETKVDIIASELDENTMVKIIVKKLTYFFTTLNIKWMAESTIEKFVSNGYDDLWKILEADKKDIQQIEGLGKTIVDKLYVSIDDGLQERKLEEIMAASQIFGRGIGVRKFKLITQTHSNILQIYKESGLTHVTELINNIVGFDTKTTSKIVDNMGEFIKYLDKFLKLKPNLLKQKIIRKSKSSKKEKSDSDYESDLESKSKSKSKSKLNLSKYKGKTIVFTGFRDKEIEEQLEQIGSKISGSVSKNTELLVASDPNENSNKIVKAKELEIEVISKEEFYKRIGK